MPETSTSLRRLVESKYNAGSQSITLDATSFGDQIGDLLALLNIEQLLLTGATLTPPAGTTPLPDTWLLGGTATVWGVAQCPFQIGVSPGQQNVTAVQMSSSLASITLPKLVQFALPLDPEGAAGLDSIVFTSGKIAAIEPDGTLSFSATIADGWSPFGLSKVHLESIRFRMAVIVDPDWGRAQKAILKANLALGTKTIPVEIDVPIGAGAWSAGIVPPGVTINLLSDIADLLGGSDYQAALPKQLVDMTTLQLESMIVQFDPKGPSLMGIDASIGTANPWPIASNIQVEKVGLALRVRPASTPTVSGTVFGSLKLDPLEFDVTIPFPLSGSIDLSGRTNQPLPGFGVLAKLVDAPFAASLPDGIANLGSLQINNMFLSYDLTAGAISSLGIEIASSAPWTLIPKYLSLENLLFGITAQKLSGGWMIEGGASGTIVVANTRVGIAVAGGAGAWDIRLTEPLLLPGLGELVNLVGGDDASTALPPGFDGGIGALTIYTYEMAFGGAGNSLQKLSLSFGTSNPWKFWDPYFILEQLNVTLSVTGPTGSRVLDANILGVLGIAGIDVVLSAQKPATSAGWTLTGGLGPDQELAVGDFISYLLSEFQVTAPDALQKFTLNSLQVSFVTDTKAFTFHVGGQFQIADASSDFTVDFDVNPQGQNGFTLDVKGDFYIGPAHFLITFAKTRGTSALTATWDQANAPIDFATIAGALGFSPPDIPENLELKLTSAGFSYDFVSGRLALGAKSARYGQFVFFSEILKGQRMYLFDFNVPLNIRLSDIPVAGPQIPPSIDAGIQSLELTYANAELAAGDVSTVKEVFAAIGAKLGPSTLPQGMSFSGVLLLGRSQQQLSLPASATQTQATAVAPTTPTRADEAKAAAGVSKWFTIQKSLGPFRLERLGVQYKEQRLGVLFDAGVNLLGVRLDLLGLGINLPLSKPRLEDLAFGLDGLELSVKQKPLEISGALLKVYPTDDDISLQYDGRVLVRAEVFSLAALGSYAVIRDQPSLFIFAVLHKELGGPAFFFVTGLAFGFGVNRLLKLPAIAEVQNFPLIKGATDPEYFGSDATPRTALAKLQEYIPPSVGDYWLAAGVKFNSFGMIDSFAMLSVSFGTQFQIAILGLSRISVPKQLPGAAPVDPVACAELAIKVTFTLSTGLLAAEARLTENSFVFSKECKLRGGFALYCWFGPEHAGDFVVTLGGYHPKFVPPAHYPIVPRLGMNWLVSENLALSGELYFALTPSCLMAGGKLSAVYQAGSLRAWFYAGADFLINWQPFAYDIEMGVRIGVSYVLSALDTNQALTIEIGAQLHMWGPPFGGLATITLYIISFDLSFGAPQQPVLEKVEWEAFQQSFLPQAEDPGADPLLCTIRITSGLIKTQEVTKNGKKSTRNVVNAHELSFTTESVVPATSVLLNSKPVEAIGLAPRPVGIRPMDIKALSSVHAVSLESTGQFENEWASYLAPTLITKSVPDALWSNSGLTRVDRPGSDMIEAVPNGVRVGLRNREPSHGLAPIELAKFKYERIGPKDIAWEEWQPPVPIPAPGDKTLASTIWNNPTVDATRKAILRALGKENTQIDLRNLAAASAEIFQSEPDMAGLGEPFKQPLYAG